MGKFLRIIGSNEYEDCLREGIYKYIPKKILYVFQEKIKPRLICNYLNEDNKEIVGYGIGVFLDENMLTRDQYISRIIDSINILKEQDEYTDIEYLVIDNLKLGYDDISIIQEKCNVKIPDGKSCFMDNIMRLLNKICKVKSKEIQEQEILILSDDTKNTENLAIDISSIIKFLTIYSNDEKFGLTLEKNILETTGLSLNIARNRDKLIGNFDFIINLHEGFTIDINRFKKDTIIIDTSENKVLLKDANKNGKRLLLIDDLFFKNDKKVYSDRKDSDFGKEINTSLSKLIKNTNKDIVKIKIYDKIYNVPQGIKDYSFQNRNVSHFEET